VPRGARRAALGIRDARLTPGSRSPPKLSDLAARATLEFRITSDVIAGEPDFSHRNWARQRVDPGPTLFNKWVHQATYIPNARKGVFVKSKLRPKIFAGFLRSALYL
jgi:hypothetical protein